MVSLEPVILDAGPSLNFLGAKAHDLLVETMALRGRRLLLPETVVTEVSNKSNSSGDARFRGCDKRLGALVARGSAEVLADSIHDLALVVQVENLTGLKAAVRLKQPPNLGEVMVIAHALCLRDSGHDVAVLIDDGDGRKLAKGRGLRLLSTHGVLVAAAQYGIVPKLGEMKTLYQSMSKLDDGLVSWDALAFDDVGSALHTRSTYGSKAND